MRDRFTLASLVSLALGLVGVVILGWGGLVVSDGIRVDRENWEVEAVIRFAIGSTLLAAAAWIALVMDNP
jgi:drug/metabolite transporter (DMT)-like permease